MMDWALSFIFGSIVIINFVLQYYFSKENGRLKQFKNHFAGYYLNWLFLPFNILFIYSVDLNFFSIFIVLTLSTIATIISHKYWGKKSLKNLEDGPFFKKGTNNLSKSGKVNSIFSVVQLSLIILFMIHNNGSLLSHLLLLPIVIFLLMGLISSKKIHGRVILSDLLMIIIGIILLILGFFLL
jgi:hypothetical protein